MTLYSSREPFNDDPLPWRVAVGPWRGSRADARYAVEMERDPRPEYNRPQNNPTNPILVARREHPGENIYYWDLERWPTEGEKEHARRVLTRLANFQKEES